MIPNEQVNAFLDRVCAHIQWRGYRLRVRRELTDHILTRAALLQQQRGFSEEQAVVQAICMMGDPDELGHTLRSSKSPFRQFCLVLFSCALWAGIAFCAIYLLLHLPF